MDPIEIPDLSNWVENLASRTLATDNKGNVIGLAKFFFKFDSKNSDKRFHKLMQYCMIFYAFETESAAKIWTMHVDDGAGKIIRVVFSAILMDRSTDKWAIGLPGESWSPENHYDGEQITGITIKLKTIDGIKELYIRNPEYEK